jgi:hypothetical protein
MVHEFGHGRVRLGLASRRGLLEQLAELDLRRPFGPSCLPQPDLTARWQGSRCLAGPMAMATAVHRATDIGPRLRLELAEKSPVGRVGLEPTTGGL